VIRNSQELSSYKGVILALNEAYLAPTSGSAVDYTLDSKNVVLAPSSETTDYLISTDSSVVSEKNIEIAGSGILNVSSSEGHGFDGGDIRVYETPTINILSTAKDGFHGETFSCNNGETAGTSKYESYAGSISLANISEQAFDFSSGSGTTDDPFTGTVDIASGTAVVVSGAKNVVSTDNSLTIEGSLVATDISEDAVVTANTGNCAITTTGTFTVNGIAYPDATI
jgi:hypothetical protein